MKAKLYVHPTVELSLLTSEDVITVSAETWGVETSGSGITGVSVSDFSNDFGFEW